MRALILALLLLPAHAIQAGNLFEEGNPGGRKQFEPYFDDETTPWQEIQANLPAYPQPANLVRIEIGPTARHEVFVDAKSLSSDADGVVRYSLLVKSAAGAETVSYEGMRCENAERKIYAFGRPSGEWARNRRAAWGQIPVRAANNPHGILFFHYFCSVNSKRDTLELQRILRSGGLYQ
ncbi:MAG: CNP1-like family protein [Betaproteobacteria bacterium]|nr:CNP1-like family protein [Betaproteobacteria bacterium]